MHQKCSVQNLLCFGAENVGEFDPRRNVQLLKILPQKTQPGPSAIEPIADLNHSVKWDFLLRRVNNQNSIVIKNYSENEG
jgi:hypothetical protein